jgi:hypothetical protein
MRDAASYEAVFGGELPLEGWPKAVMVLRATDAFLKREGVAQKRPGERFLRNWRQVAALLAVARVTGTFAFSRTDLSRLDIGLLTDEVFRETWAIVNERRPPTSTGTPRKQLVRQIAEDASVRLGIEAPEAVEARHPFSAAYRTRIDDAFINDVDAALPDQPWKPGVHRDVAVRLNCQPRRVSEAIEALVLAGRRYAQRDGVVFGEDGAVIAFDPERVTADEAQGARLED